MKIGATQQTSSKPVFTTKMKLQNGITKSTDVVPNVISYEIDPRKADANELKNFAQIINLDRNQLGFFNRLVSRGSKFTITGIFGGKFIVIASNT